MDGPDQVNDAAFAAHFPGKGLGLGRLRDHQHDDRDDNGPEDSRARPPASRKGLRFNHDSFYRALHRAPAASPLQRLAERHGHFRSYSLGTWRVEMYSFATARVTNSRHENRKSRNRV